MSDTPAIFKNTLEVLGWLKKSGYKVGKSKLYADAKAGMLPAGACAIEDVERYARRVRLKRQAEVSGGELDRMAKQRGEAEYRLLQKKYEKLEFELEKDKGQYFPRDQFEQELSARMAVLKHGFSHLAQSRANELLELGKSKGPQAMADEMEAEFEGLLNDYANRESFQVIILANDSINE